MKPHREAIWLQHSGPPGELGLVAVGVRSQLLNVVTLLVEVDQLPAPLVDLFLK